MKGCEVAGVADVGVLIEKKAVVLEILGQALEWLDLANKLAGENGMGEMSEWVHCCAKKDQSAAERLAGIEAILNSNGFKSLKSRQGFIFNVTQALQQQGEYYENS